MEENNTEKAALGSIKGRVYIKQSDIAANMKVSTTIKAPKSNILKYTLGNN